MKIISHYRDSYIINVTRCKIKIMSDPNMETLRAWAAEFPLLDALPINLENNTGKLIDIVDFVNSCLGKEFAKDREQFVHINGREPGPNDFYNILCKDYDENRKKQFLDCIKKCLKREILEVDEKYQMNLALRLWPGCLDAAKVLSLGTRSGRNTQETRRLSIPTVHSRAANDPVYRKGVEIACLWESNPDNVCFDGVPVDSLVRMNETEWSKRKGNRPIKQCGE